MHAQPHSLCQQMWKTQHDHRAGKGIGYPLHLFLGFSCGSADKESTYNAGDPRSIPGLGKSPGERIGYPLQYSWASLVAQLVKNPPAVRKTWVRSLDWDPLEKGIGYPLQYSWGSLVAQLVKNLPAMWETWVRSLGWEDPLEEAMATHSSIVAGESPMDGGAWRATVHGVAKNQT